MSTTDDPSPASRAPWLVPSIATLLVLILGLFPAVVITSGGGGSMEMTIGEEGVSSTSWYRLGPGLAYVKTQIDDGVTTKEVTIGWIAIAVVLLVAYPIAAFVTHRVRALLPPRSARVLLIVVPVLIASAAVLASGAASRSYWGYWFSRPSPTSISRHMHRTTGYAFVDNGSYKNVGAEPAQFRASEVRAIDSALEYDEEWDDVRLSGRILVPLLDRGLTLEGLPTVEQDDLDRLLAFLQTRGVLPEPTAGYENNINWLWGVVVIGEDAGGAPVLLAAITTGEVSDDHRGHVELALDWPPDGSPTVRDRITFFYDLSGLEGLDWSVVARGLGLLGAAVFSLVVGILACIPRRVPGAPTTPEIEPE